MSDISKDPNLLMFQLNCELQDEAWSDMPRLVYESDGYTEGISFLGIGLWDSEANQVPYAEDGTSRSMPLDAFVKQRFNQLMKQLGRITL